MEDVKGINSLWTQINSGAVTKSDLASETQEVMEISLQENKICNTMNVKDMDISDLSAKFANARNSSALNVKVLVMSKLNVRICSKRDKNRF